MKKISIIALILVLSLSLVACRRKNETMPTETTPTATQAPTTADTTPQTDPTLDTNIPDPTVDSNSNQPEDNTETTDLTGTEENNTLSEDAARMRSRMMR